MGVISSEFNDGPCGITCFWRHHLVRLHYNMWLQFSGKGLSSTNILFHNFILLSTLTLFFTPQQANKAQPVSVSFCIHPKLLSKLNEGKACSETTFVPIHEDLARKESLPMEAP